MSTPAAVPADLSMANLDSVHDALAALLSAESDEARAVRSLFKDDASMHDVRLLRLLTKAVTEGVRHSIPSPAVCMHAHGFEPATNEPRRYCLHPADNGPDYRFTVIYDTDLPVSEPYYAAGVMIDVPKLRVLRCYPHTVLFYVIVDGPYRGVRLCSLAAIKSLGVEPQYPTLNDPYPSCRSFYTAAEAFHYLHLALLNRGLVVPGSRYREGPSSTSASAADSSPQTMVAAGPMATPDTSPESSPIGPPAELAHGEHIELAWTRGVYVQKPDEGDDRSEEMSDPE